MTSAEMDKMFQLIKLYTETEMDQWDKWKFNDNFGKVYISFTRGVPNSEKDAYTDISHLIENRKA